MSQKPADPKAPIAVQNLRRIWQAKKVEMGINQTEAAEKLGWSQSAFSQYLNNYTELNTEAVTKLANLFGVDPADIDPNIGKKLPKHSNVSFIHADRKENLAIQINREELKFAILLKKETVIPWRNSRFIAPTGSVLLCGKPALNAAGPFAFTKKDKTTLTISKKQPERNTVKFLYAINFISLK